MCEFEPCTDLLIAWLTQRHCLGHALLRTSKSLRPPGSEGGQVKLLLAMEIKERRSTFESYYKGGCCGRNLIATASLPHPCGLLGVELGSIPLCGGAPTAANGWV